MAAQLVQAPNRPQLTGKKSIVLAGTTTSSSGSDWRKDFGSAFSIYPVTILNPLRPDWDSTWKEDASDVRWAEQVRWELDMQDAADLVVVVLHGTTLAPISMLELGLVVGRRPEGVVVCATPEYQKRGNVEAVCHRFGVPVVSSEEALWHEVKRWLDKQLV